MVKGYAKVKQSVIGIGNHLGSFSDEDSNSYIKAMEYGVLNGINSLDTAVNSLRELLQNRWEEA